jgi:hypothetical protein
MTIGADGEVTNSVTIENAEAMKTQKVGANGQVYLGQDYGGKQVVVAFRVEGEPEETDESDSKDTEN